MDPTLNYQIHTFGCKVNTYDSGLIQSNLKRSGFEDQSNEKQKSQIHVLNTCAVTGEATQQAVRLIRKLKTEDPSCTIVITGCAAQVDTAQFSDLPGADLIVANSHKSDLSNLIRQHMTGLSKERVFKSNIFKKEDLEAGGGIEKSHTRSFLKIQDGCNSFCSFCIIPYARGKSRSVPVSQLVDKINELYTQNIKEVVLTGVHIGDYQDESREQGALEDLLEELLNRTQIPRIRLSSLEPVELTERLLDLYQDQRMCRHFHMSIQSAQTQVLKDMKRKYDQDAVKKALLAISKKLPGSYVGMDVIAGFPTESEEQFQETYLTLADLPWTRIHVFPYSERSGTKAAAMAETIPWEIRTRRASRLRELSFQRLQEMAIKQVGHTKKILILKKKSRGAHGLSRDFWPVQLTDHLDRVGEFAGQEIEVQIDAVAASNLQAQDALLCARWGTS